VGNPLVMEGVFSAYEQEGGYCLPYGAIGQRHIPSAILEWLGFDEGNVGSNGVSYESELHDNPRRLRVTVEEVAGE